MKNLIKNSAVALLIAIGVQAQAQDKISDEDQLDSRNLPNYRPPSQLGINTFEPDKDTLSDFEEIEVRIGGAFALQFQALDHENSGAVPLIEIGDNFNLATANLDFDVMLYEGVILHLRTYLSSRHHPEPYVKGGYLQIDKLDFIREGFMDELMNHMRIRIGHMENNYGDAHFRRTDNASAIYNPFVGNLIMDAFTTEVGAEVYYFQGGFLGMIGATNGKLNQAVTAPGTSGPSWLAKIGYDTGMDNQYEDDFRFRLTGSVYHTNKVQNSYLYSADRAGSRYYLVLEPVDATSSDNFRSGRINPGLGNEVTAFMINPFLRFGGLEFFGTYETATGKRNSEADDRSWNQYAGELIYRFGRNENFYAGGRYNLVSGEEMGGNDVEVSRYNLAAGWFMTKNILAKVEYVSQNHEGYLPTSILHEGHFDGLMLEAVISF